MPLSKLLASIDAAVIKIGICFQKINELIKLLRYCIGQKGFASDRILFYFYKAPQPFFE